MKKPLDSVGKLKTIRDTHEQRMKNLRIVTKKMRDSNAKLRSYLKLPESK